MSTFADAPAATTRRDFLTVSGTAFAAVGASLSLWPLLDSAGPSASARAEATLEVDLAPIQPGQIVTVMWQGKPVFVAHRTPEQIARAEAQDEAATMDPAPDRSRAGQREWLVVVGVCTHLGCVPTRGAGGLTAQFEGWVCPCHFSQYDLSGRVRRGPAPKNLAVPPHTFTTPTRLLIG